jgi:hypothetical protein
VQTDAVEAQDGAVCRGSLDDNVVAEGGEVVVLSCKHLADSERAG